MPTVILTCPICHERFEAQTKHSGRLVLGVGVCGDCQRNMRDDDPLCPPDPLVQHKDPLVSTF